MEPARGKSRKSPLIIVTGSTGALGGRVAAKLAANGTAQRLIVRDKRRAPDLADAEIAVASSHGDFEAMRKAMEGADTLFLVSAREGAGRIQEHKTAVDAAVAAGIERIIYVSFLNAASDSTFTLAREHYATEQYIRASGVAFTFLQDSLYLDIIPLLASAEGLIAGPAGSGTIACVARDDVAASAVAVLGNRASDGKTYRLTGCEAYSLSEAAETLSRFARRPVNYKNETLEEAYASRAHYGAPHDEVEGWVSSYLAIADGQLSTITDDVSGLTGRRPMTLAEFLSANPTSYAHLSA